MRTSKRGLFNSRQKSKISEKIEGIFSIILVTALLVSLISFNVLAEDTENSEGTDEITKAFNCLEEKVDGNCDDLSVEEQAFSLLALSHKSGIQSECKSALKDNRDDNQCWPSSGCRLRDTALVILALNRISSSTEDAENWLLEQKKIPPQLNWYLEIDADGETQCEVSYDDTEKTITINEDKTLSGSTGNCLDIGLGNYFLKIEDTCYDKNFSVSCDKDFISTLFYKKGTSSTIHISSNTQSAPAEGTTKHTVNSYCFKQGSSCSYEGSLWAALALAKTGHDISQFIPYLTAMADDNEKYFPSAFLYMITNDDDYFSGIIDDYKPSGYWEVSNSPYHKFYDTALALVSLYGLDATQVQESKNYLLEVQGENGCWRNNIRDTGFILYAAWPKSPSTANGGDIDYCEDYEYYCVASEDCSSSDTLNNYYCEGIGDVCCQTPVIEQSCLEKGGTICSGDQICDGEIVSSSDGSCCLGICSLPEIDECVEQGYLCRYACLENEEEKIYECSGGKICCGDSPKGGYLWIIILLIILIILVILAIIFRNQLKIWIFRIKNKFKKGPGPSQPKNPRFPPSAPPGMQRMMPRMFLPRNIRMPRRRPPKASSEDKELDDTLKKLKEMSK